MKNASLGSRGGSNLSSRKRVPCGLVLISLLVLAPLAGGGTALPEDRGAAGLWQALLKLRTSASALHITAHPDDEDGPMLTLLARGQF